MSQSTDIEYQRTDNLHKPSTLAIPAPGQGKRGVDGYMAYLLRQANAAARLALERSLAELGATLPQFLVMTMLRAYPGLSGADLARIALLTPQTVGLITRNLERLGAVEKTAHPSHGRILQFTLTPSGTQLLDQCRERAHVVERRLTHGLSAEDEAVVRRWLVAITEDLGAGPAEAPAVMPGEAAAT